MSIEVVDEEGGYDYYIIYLFCQMSIWIMGTIGNSLSGVFFSQKEFHSSATGFLFRSLAILDFIVVQEHIESIFIIIDIDVLTFNTIICKIFRYIFVCGRITAVWTLVAIGVERLICVVWPHQAKIICTLKRTKIFIICLVISVWIYEIPQLLTIEMVHYVEEFWEAKYCNVNYNTIAGQYMLKLEPWFAFCLYSVLPACVLLVVNIVIIIFVQKAHQKRKSYQSRSTSAGQSSGSSSDAQVNNMTIMLLCVSLSFLILTAPWCIYIIMNSVTGNYIQLFADVSFLLLAMNHSINFFLYCLSGRRFREKFVNMFRCSNGGTTYSETASTQIQSMG